LDQFVYRVSHDMRSPLSSLMGLINLIRIEKTPSQDSEYINMLEDQVHKLDTFLNSMLNFSKASRGQSQHELIRFDEVIDDCLAEFEGHPNYYQLMVNVNIEGDQYAFANDLTRLKIIIRNLLSNAFEYLNPSTEMPFLYIYVKIEPDTCRLMFDDNGIGIAYECLDKVFNMFYRASELSNGSGLGLYIVQQAIQKLNGVIQLESSEKVGTKIKIELPNLAQNNRVDQTQEEEDHIEAIKKKRFRA
ncbi:MAG: sensor histidine kinase, partial [Flammeovirgaceae bacterium]